MRLLLRMLLLSLHVLQGCITALIVFPYADRRRRNTVVGRWSRRALVLLGIQVRRNGMLPSTEPTGVLFVSNHISWIDILALNAFHPCHFVAMAEIRHWPLVGWMAARTGTIFLRRGWAKDLDRARRAVAARLSMGQPVAIFPEGTTTDGSMPAAFHAGLLQAAIETRAPLWPCALRYVRENTTRHEGPVFSGETALLHSVWRVMRGEPIVLQMVYADPFSPATHDRRALADRAYGAIATLVNTPPHYSPTPSASTHTSLPRPSGLSALSHPIPPIRRPSQG